MTSRERKFLFTGVLLLAIAVAVLVWLLWYTIQMQSNTISALQERNELLERQNKIQERWCSRLGQVNVACESALSALVDWAYSVPPPKLPKYSRKHVGIGGPE